MSDCTEIVLSHRKKVGYWMEYLVSGIKKRAEVHDQSKLKEPEKPVFDIYSFNVPKFGDSEYEKSLEAMKDALKHHYSVNRHHPEYYEHGIAGMTILDVIEMLADWMAACSEKGEQINVKYLKERFSISDDLMSIICNTLLMADADRMYRAIPDEHVHRLPFLPNDIKLKNGRKGDTIS